MCNYIHKTRFYTVCHYANRVQTFLIEEGVRRQETGDRRKSSYNKESGVRSQETGENHHS
ncbi:MAG: hypothetical protein F6K48_25455 [Okeania sp. SIO3H1]|uniref:hypothetical protein n=1 Tax=Okeania sp. SIO1I7 TaxID=2607772 RepID=UPI0013CC280B|nr:hypothetical protein [Okeania sp. SIO1I7]NEN92069.1 hypothetical protein [Okeania sp. SIO3H1]NET24690.1 hypothetical protein [Okeania sp. SIO1I7]